MKTTRSQEIDSSGPADTAASLGLELASEMRRRWRRGERPVAEEFLDQYAELRQRPETAIDIIYEEFCLRQAAGEQDADQEIIRRFPQWRGPLEAMLDCHRVLLPSGEASDFPSVGDRVGGFRLVAELGRGSSGRVSLATQTDLAGRPVVLKLTPLDGAEHLSLARLQHTNIVPVYSVVDDAGRSVRILCMPYFGRTTLASLLESLAGVPFATRTGQHIAAAVDKIHQPVLNPAPSEALSRQLPAPVLPHADPKCLRGSPTAPALQMLANVSYVQAACWITACLADALQYAHERGLVHLDVKPSNVLLAGDGQPMLLDFHLAREPIRSAGPLPDKFGGTPAYMPPEQLAAMQALQHGRSIEHPVDGRADIYALGAILHEMLSGMLPLVSGGWGRVFEPPANGTSGSHAGWGLEDSTPATPLSNINPHVSVGLADIIAKCLAPRPDDRYSSAAAMADDLRRHLADQPLAGATNRSLAERWHKWRRRRSDTVRVCGMLAIIVAAASLALAGAWSRIEERSREAEQALRTGQTQLDESRPGEAAATFERGLSLIEGLPIRRDLAGKLRDQLASARRLRVAGQLHELADQIRVLFGADSLPPARLRPLAKPCNEFWDKREQIATSLDAIRDSEVATDLLDVAIFWADLQVQLASDAAPQVAATLRVPSTKSSDTAHRVYLLRALRTLDEAESMFGPSRVLDYQRMVYRKGLAATHVADGTTSAARSESATGLSGGRMSRIFESRQFHGSVAGTRRLGPPYECWEHYALGRALLNSNNLAQAAKELGAALALDPSGPWPNFYYGLCAYRIGRHEDAVAAFSVCIGAAPNIAGCFYNRALAYNALGRTDRALHDYDRALKLDPALAAAWLNRGMLHYKREQYPKAVADLRQALHHGADAATVHTDLALVHLAVHDTASAVADVDHVLEIEPSHELARQLRDSLLRTDAESGSKR